MKDTEFWVISGDLPTDYLSGSNVIDARTAVNAFAKRWIEVSSYMIEGKRHPTFSIGTEENRKELGSLLLARAETLKSWAEDDEIW